MYLAKQNKKFLYVPIFVDNNVYLNDYFRKQTFFIHKQLDNHDSKQVITEKHVHNHESKQVITEEHMHKRESKQVITKEYVQNLESTQVITKEHAES